MAQQRLEDEKCLKFLLHIKRDFYYKISFKYIVDIGSLVSSSVMSLIENNFEVG